MPATSTIVDAFDDGTLNTTLWSGSYGTVTESGGRARIDCTTAYTGLQTANAYTFDMVCMQVVPPTPGAATECYVDLLLRSAAQAGGTDICYHINAVTGQLVAQSRSGYFDGSAVTVTYNPTNHAWLRLRSVGANTLFEASPDGAAWMTIRTLATPAWLSAATDLSIDVESHRDAGTSDVAQVDNVNLPPATFFTVDDVVGAGETFEAEVLLATELTVPDGIYTPRWHWPAVAPSVTPQIWIYDAGGTLVAGPLSFLTTTLDRWNSASPVVLAAGTYRIGVNTTRYPFQTGFFSGGPVTRSPFIGVQGRFGPPGSAPASTSTTAYFVDLILTGTLAAGTATFAGTGVLSGAGVRTAVGTAALAGTGALSATGTVTSPTSTAALAGVGALTGTSVLTLAGAAQLAATGALTAAAVKATAGSAVFAGVGALTATGLVIPPVGVTSAPTSTLRTATRPVTLGTVTQPLVLRTR